MSRKAIFVISDTHIGAGGRDQGNKLEDFISDAEFLGWMHDLVAESNADGIEMELIINGDWIEYLQVPSVDVFEPSRQYEAGYYSDASEAAALQRLEIVYEWHPDVFQGLSDFLNADSPRRTVTILFGNHDPELVYPAVQARVREMINATGARADLLAIGERSYFRNGVYVEHGNAYTEWVDRFTDPDSPYDPDDPEQIERPIGSQIVTSVFNKVEWERPFIDGIHPVTALIFYSLAYEPSLAVELLKITLISAPDVLWPAAAAEEGEAPTAGDRLLAEMETPEQAAALAERLRSDPEYAAQFSEDVQAAMIEKGMAPAWPSGMAAAPGQELTPQERAREITEQYWTVLENEAERIAIEQGAQVVLFGHIHEPVEQTFPSGAIYLNTGTWIWKGDFSEASDKLWQDLVAHPEKYANVRDLTYARIDYDESGAITSARLERVGEAPGPHPDPDSQPDPGFWAKLLLTIKNFFKGLFGK